MSYSANNSTAIAVTNFGVKFDGVTDNRGALQAAIDSIYAKGGGVLYFPLGNYYWSGTLNVTGNNVGFYSDGATLMGGIDESAKKINVSGAQNIEFCNLNFDSRRSGGANVSNQLGFLNFTNAKNIDVNNCSFYNTRNSAIYLGGGTQFANISDNFFSGHFCGVYGYINSGEAGSERFLINNNRFADSWSLADAESAGIKIQANPGQNNVSRGHVISNNTINSTTQMGIELWKHGHNNVVSNNTVENTMFGISLDEQEDSSVTANTVRSTTYAGIELAALCKRNVVSSNTIYGYQTGQIGRLTTYALVLSNETCENNILVGNNIAGALTHGILVQNALNTTISNNIIRDCETHIYFQNGKLATVHGNLFDTGIFSTNYHIFFDAGSVSLSGYHFSDNKFRGATTQQSIFYYNNSTTNTISDVCFDSNVTDNTTAGGFGIFIGGQLTPTNYVYRNNFGPSGGNGSNSILDAGDAGGGYGTSNIVNGFQYYSHLDYNVPATTGITGSNGIWVCLWSGAPEGDQVNVRSRVYYDSNMNGFEYDDVEIWANMVPYQSNFKAHSLMVTPSVTVGTSSFFKQVKTLSHDVNASNSLWMRFGPVSSGLNKAFHIYNSKLNLLSTPYSTYTEPADTTNNANIRLDSNNYGAAYKFQNINVGNQNGVFLYSPSSGILGIGSITGATIKIDARAPNDSLLLMNDGRVIVGSGGTLLSQKLNIYENGNLRYGVGIAAGELRIYSASDGDVTIGKISNSDGTTFTPQAKFIKDGNAMVTGNFGVGVPSPTSKLHVSGSIRLDGIATSTSANAGPASALPALPVGYISINITGGNFKIPYYNT